MIKSYLVDVGLACSLGGNKEQVLKNLLNGTVHQSESIAELISGRRAVEMTLPFDLPVIDDDRFKSKNNALALLMVQQIQDSIKLAINRFGKKRIGCIMGTSSSGMLEGENTYLFHKKNGRWPDNYSYSIQETSSLSDYLSNLLDLKGPSYTISTACSSSAKALASAKRLIDNDLCDAVVVGGADTICQIIRNGFDSLELLSPTRAIPFSINRKGITLGTGGALFLISREDLNKNSPVYLSGYGETSDACHISAPDPSGIQPEKAIRYALEMANLSPLDIDYINLHGTGSFLNDQMEGQCIKRIFGKTPISSTKSLTGHTLGGCGALEAALIWLCLMTEHEKKHPLPWHVFDDNPEDPDLNFVKKEQYLVKENIHMLSNAFAFGGSNVSLILSREKKLS